MLQNEWPAQLCPKRAYVKPGWTDKYYSAKRSCSSSGMHACISGPTFLLLVLITFLHESGHSQCKIIR